MHERWKKKKWTYEEVADLSAQELDMAFSKLVATRPENEHSRVRLEVGVYDEDARLQLAIDGIPNKWTISLRYDHLPDALWGARVCCYNPLAIVCQRATSPCYALMLAAVKVAIRAAENKESVK